MARKRELKLSEERMVATAVHDQVLASTTDQLQKLMDESVEFVLFLNQLVHMNPRNFLHTLDSYDDADQREKLTSWIIAFSRLGLHQCASAVAHRMGDDNTLDQMDAMLRKLKKEGGFDGL